MNEGRLETKLRKAGEGEGIREQLKENERREEW